MRVGSGLVWPLPIAIIGGYMDRIVAVIILLIIIQHLAQRMRQLDQFGILLVRCVIALVLLYTTWIFIAGHCPLSHLLRLLLIALLPLILLRISMVVVPHRYLQQLHRLLVRIYVKLLLLPIQLLWQCITLLSARKRLAYSLSSDRLVLYQFPLSPREFYAIVEAAITELHIPSIKLSRVVWREGGIFSARREYLSVRCRDRIVIISAAPFGHSAYIISWWFGSVPGMFSLLLALPVLGYIGERFIRPTTFYSVDTMAAFHRIVHGKVKQVAEAVLEAYGISGMQRM
jgi:hypothetical protein